ncbi:MAG TPA: STAS domain-containing protein [Nocardioidaceae bacterium]|nr:STAS domain-containing protein [Nocardioidaceae bacterium]
MTPPWGVSPPARDPVLILPPFVEPAAITGLCRGLEAILDDPEVTRATVDTGAMAHPDITTVDALARLQLTARRRGRSMHLAHMTPALHDLLALAGLGDTLGDPEPT